MPFQIIRNDITKMNTDVIVNSANPLPIYASGTDAAIYKAAGAEQLLEARRGIGKISRGNVAVTPAFLLQAKYIIHAVGPMWQGGDKNEMEILASCYENSLKKAVELQCKSIAFPLIAAGTYGFPKDAALQTAITSISSFLTTLESELDVFLVVFDKRAYEISGKLFSEVKTFIDQNYVDTYKKTARRFFQAERKAMPERTRCEEVMQRPRPYEMDAELMDASLSLEDILEEKEETFQERLLQLIDASGMTDAEVYKKANIDRKLFSKIRCNPDYKPKKKTAIALALALELDYEETVDLLQRAEMAFSKSSKFDLIIAFFLQHHNYDVFEINSVLFQYDQPILG